MPTGGAVKLTIDSNKYGWVEFPDGTMQVTLNGVINTTYTGATGEIKYFVPKNNVGQIAISSSDLAGKITYNGNFGADYFRAISTKITGANFPNKTIIDLSSNSLLTNILAPNAVNITAAGCALTAKSIGDILYQAYVANRQNVNFNFSGGTNATSGAVNTYLLAKYGIAFATVYAALDVTGTILYNA